MGKPSGRAAMTVRLDPESKKLLEAQAEEVGLDPGAAARMILETYIQKLRTGVDYVEAMAAFRTALKLPPATE